MATDLIESVFGGQNMFRNDKLNEEYCMFKVVPVITVLRSLATKSN